MSLIIIFYIMTEHWPQKDRSDSDGDTNQTVIHRRNYIVLAQTHTDGQEEPQPFI